MLTRKAYAKINWTLDILGKREDGYHLMDMLMQSVSVADDMTFSLREDGKVTLHIQGSALAADESNLVLRAAKALQDKANCPLGADIRMVKNIPMGAGMGGGSADAACTIHALCELWHIDMTLEEKCALGLTLGADVPYCLFGKPARVTGIGEVITPIAMQRTYPLVCIQPCQALSTKEAFRHFDQTVGIVSPDTDQAMAGFTTGDSAVIAGSCRNVMQHASELLRPAMGKALRDIAQSGAFLSEMTGSGSVVFGAYGSAEAADRACETLRKMYPNCFRADTLVQTV